MHTNRIEICICLAVSLISHLSILSAAPQQDQELDLGIYKLEDLEDGFAIRREMNIDTPFSQVIKKREISFDNPVVQSVDSDSSYYSDSEDHSHENESSRPKREAVDHISIPNENLERRKRSPCYETNTVQPTPEPTDVEEARRRRSVAGKTLQAERKTKGYGKKSKSKYGRRRRQAEIEKFNNEDQNAYKNVGEHVDRGIVILAFHASDDTTIHSSNEENV